MSLQDPSIGKNTTPKLKSIDSIPGSRGLPFVGETPILLRDPDFFTKRFKKHGYAFNSRLFGYDVTFLVGHEANRVILTREVDLLIAYGTTMQDLLSDTLFEQNGEEAKIARRAILPAFSKDSIARIVPTIASTIDQWLKRWELLGEFDWFKEFNKFVFELGTSVWIRPTSGITLEELDELLVTWLKGFTQLPLDIPGTRWNRARKARQRWVDEVKGAIRAHDGDAARCPHLWHSRAPNADLTHDDAAKQSMLMVFAGNLTTASFLTSFAYAMKANPHVEQKARDEVRSLADVPTTPQGLDALPYLGAVAQEIERLYPPVGFSLRSILENIDVLGYHIPKGTVVGYSVFLTHRDPKRFKDPLKFEPERFLRDDAPGPYDIVGFARGPRRCPGAPIAYLVLKMMASRLLRDYEWELTPGQDTRMRLFPTARPVDDLRVRFRRRRK